MNELLVDRLKNARTECGLKQQEVAKQLGLKANTISNWEQGRTEPDIDTFVKLCDIYKIDCAALLADVYAFKRIGSDISLQEYDNIKQYRNLDKQGRLHVDTVLGWETERIKELSRQHKQDTKTQKEVPPFRIIQYYQRLASAGKGEYLFDDIPTDTIKVKDTPVSCKADFVIGVNGDSMEPDYYDGEKVFVEKTADLEIGEVGIFVQGENCYIKELGKNRLVSRNKKCLDVIPTEGVRIVGKVLGKVEY